jgi:large subunit ribosomal protein L4
MEKTLSIRTAGGTEAGTFPLPPAWLEEHRGTQAVKDVVVAFLASRRAGTASTKTRGNVRGGGAKPYRQKGTGRARAGSNRSPIWRKGGVIFGPLPRDYDKKVNRSTRTLALRRAFTERLAEDAVIVVDRIELAAPKTREAVGWLRQIGAGDRALVVTAGADVALERAVGNLPGVMVLKAAVVNPYWLLLFPKIVFTREALDAFGRRLAGNAQEVTA